MASPYPKRTPKDCAICGKTMFLIDSQYKRVNCCSRKCGYKNRRSFKGRLNPAWKGGWSKCIECGIEVKSRYAKRCSEHRGVTYRGAANCNWKNGKLNPNELARRSSRQQAWRKAVFKRDNYTCQECGVKNHVGLGKTVRLNADHIKPFAKHPELRLDINNGRTLCEDCHRETPTYAGRMWKYAPLTSS